MDTDTETHLRRAERAVGWYLVVLLVAAVAVLALPLLV